MTPKPLSPTTKRIHMLALMSGLAALSWEVIWQIKSTLALGVSAWGTAITLAVTMGGMGIGSLVMGGALKGKAAVRPLRIYGILEIIIGASGLFLGVAFNVIEQLDTWAYTAIPGNGSWVHLLGIVIALGIPAICMGGTLPVWGLVAQQFRTSIAALYGLNTVGAACGALLAAILIIPLFGVTRGGWVIAFINIVVGIIAWYLGQEKFTAPAVQKSAKAKSSLRLNVATQRLIITVTGFATLGLEVSWFRSLTAAFGSTTDAFAIMLACVLAALSIGAWFVSSFKKREVQLGPLVAWAGIFVLIATPIIERFDILLYGRVVSSSVHVALARATTTVMPTSWYNQSFNMFTLFRWTTMTFFIVGPPMFLVGIATPWILDEQRSSRQWGTMYALNTLAGIAGSISAAWLFLPNIGFSSTAAMMGAMVVLVGVIAARRKQRIICAAIGIVALFIAVHFESGISITRAQGSFYNAAGFPAQLVEAFTGPEATVSVVQQDDGLRRLLIDGTSASGQSSKASIGPKYDHYMPWMGRLPMLLHSNPKNALVICFGTGQTANAVRRENPKSLDIVDINPRIFKLAHNFSSNQGVLNDPKVTPIVMDGRAYMRRTKKTYDIITLEPMPPHFSGVNALYSREFYQYARQRLSAQGVIAQWVPFHSLDPYYAASIVKTFREVFPNAVLWLDPVTHNNAIVLGTKDDGDEAFGSNWPGFKHAGEGRDLSEDEVRKAMLLNHAQTIRFGNYGKVISDDNQLLSYGMSVLSQHWLRDFEGEDREFIDQMKKNYPE